MSGDGLVDRLFVDTQILGRCTPVSEMKVVTVGLRDVDKGLGSEGSEVRHVRLVAAPGFFRSYVIQGMCG